MTLKSFILCLLGIHDYYFVESNLQEKFNTDFSKLPYERRTNILLRCSKCGAFKVKSLEGKWSEEKLRIEFNGEK